MSSLALVYGLNYEGTAKALKGCVNDARAVGTFLRESARFDRVRVVTDEARDDVSAISIMKAVDDLVALTNVQDVRHLWLHFSGHGAQIAAHRPGEESDRKDECFLASDHPIRDDFFRRALSRANPSAHIVIVFDCCHSGTMCDMDRGPMSSDVVCLSGCEDHETTRDEWDETAREWRGAFTTALLASLRTRLHSSIADVLGDQALRRVVSTTSQRRTHLL
jgi:hypothetical protein